MSPAHVVLSGSGRARRYLAPADAAAGDGPVRPPFTWMTGAARAVTFPSAGAARAFALAALGHSQFDIGAAPVRSET